MELNSLFDKFKGKSNKIITFILVGVLLLIIVMPVKNKSDYLTTSNKITNENMYNDTSSDSMEVLNDYTDYADYYEDKLKEILEKSYGEGTMNVMVSLKSTDAKVSYYYDGSSKAEFVVDGVLIVADVKNTEVAADIAFAVCSLFNLPAHKVAVLMKN
ncbi:MAG: hypothetical protein IJ167_08720 [Lachnospiraceae bacterium]|nr:hypothetical protein [Lachnospiraceae bacterium]